MKLLILVCATLLGLPVSVLAEDKNGFYKSWFPGDENSCGPYIEARAEGRWTGSREKESTYAIWLMGYLTGVNAGMPDTFDISPADQYEELLWLENWCKKHPLEPFTRAADSLIVELHPKRIKQAPKSR